MKAFIAEVGTTSVSRRPLAIVNAYEYSQVFAKDPKTVQNYSENSIHKTLDRL